uniref:HMA domain-containing protein n=1 Tax=Eptatretus burgeri TaxID=7764 RepID=A0A8C4N4A4_EPTBU
MDLHLCTTSVLQRHEFFVDMTCEGCSASVARVLDKKRPVAESESRFDIKLSTFSEEKDTESTDRWV